MADNLTKIDEDLAGGATFKMGASAAVTILFQFPPKILSDNRTGTWDEIELPGSQPISIWKTSGARKWTLEWTYVVGARNWSVDQVRNQIVNLRSYYEAREDLLTNFIVWFKIWKLGGSSEMTCRLGNIDISHGKALYVPDNNIQMAHPVVTNIKVAMQLWTKGDTMKGGAANIGAVGGFAAGTEKSGAARTSTGAAIEKIDATDLKPFAPLDWQ